MSSRPSHPREGYAALAHAFEQANGIRSFATVRPLLKRIPHSYPLAPRTHLDIACGTGLAVQFFAKEGFASIGVDLSLPALALARTRSCAVVAADAWDLPFAGPFGCITLLNESIRVLTRHSNLRRFLTSLRRFMTSESILLFDLSKPALVARWVRRGEVRFRGPDHDFSVQTRYVNSRRGEELRFTGTVFDPPCTVDEVHRQAFYSRREVVNALRDARLTPVQIKAFDRLAGRDARTAWLFVVARR